MARFLAAAKRFVTSEDAPSIVEYALMVALITVVCIVAVTALGGALNDRFMGLNDSVNDATP